MKIQFDIKEQLTDIVAEVLSSKWQPEVKEDRCGMKRITLPCSATDKSPATIIDIWKAEIHIKPNHDSQNYRIFQNGEHVACEYIGPQGELFRHKPFPTLTPTKGDTFKTDLSIR
ncbi:MAG: hypothetical protein LBL81_00160 [Tannerella sp.]|jgi:hypothetical protein|nr:hypothetical protein [Tannerella sp.]